MTDQEQLEVWQQLKAMGIPPEQRMQALDDQMRIDSLLRSFFAQVRRDEFEEQMRIVELEFPPCVTSTSDFSSPSSALSSSGV